MAFKKLERLLQEGKNGITSVWNGLNAISRAMASVRSVWKLGQNLRWQS